MGHGAARARGRGRALGGWRQLAPCARAARPPLRTLYGGPARPHTPCVSQEATLLDLYTYFYTQREPQNLGGRWGARLPAVTLPRATPSKRSGSRDSLLAARSPGSQSFASHR